MCSIWLTSIRYVLYTVCFTLKTCGQESLLENVALAVPAFHIYGHRGSCQLQHSPRRVLGFGLSDGEQLERLWSYLRRFGKMTKEMRPSHRIDVLSDALLHYSQQCKDNLRKSKSNFKTFSWLSHINSCAKMIVKVFYWNIKKRLFSTYFT